MKVAGDYNFEAKLSTVWDALFDAGVLARTLPGCDKLEKEGDQFHGVIRVKMGPVQGKFQGKVDISDVENHQGYRMTIDGRGPSGFAKAKVSIALKEAAQGTVMTYDADIQVGGRIASVGQRLLDASIKAITKQSLESLHKQIKSLQEKSIDLNSEENIQAQLGRFGGASTADPNKPDAAGQPSSSNEPSAPSVAKVADSKVAESEVEGPSQAAFALGIAKEVTKELFPLKKVILVATVVILALAVYQVLTS